MSGLRQAYAALVGVDTETPRVHAFLRQAPAGTIVDVGCGHGRYLRPLAAQGRDVIGVDVSEAIVARNRAEGLEAMTPAQFAASGRRAKVLLMSHVIEHFEPAALLAFLDDWLDRLDPGGELIVATPLMTAQFYDDFDHVRPYHPEGLMMVFGAAAAQVQYQARNRLELLEVAIRRSPWRIARSTGLYRGGAAAWPAYALNAALALLFRLSAGLIGQSSGWIGRFRKLPARA